MANIIAHVLHDPIHNNEGYISNYAPAALQEAEKAGFVIMAEKDDGTREVVEASQVSEPDRQGEKGSLTFISPEYVDVRIKALIELIVPLFEATLPHMGSKQQEEATKAFETLKTIINTSERG